MTTRQTVEIGTGKDKVVVTVKREPGKGDVKHIFITVPSHMSWAKIWKTMRGLPKHLNNSRKKKRKEKK